LERIINGAFPRRLALDTIHGKLYWGSEDGIARANLDGSNVETVLTLGRFGVGSLAVDPIGSKVYWSRDFGIYRADLDGSNVETIYDRGLSEAPNAGLSIDPIEGKIYLSFGSAGPKIHRMNLDGSELEFVVEAGAISSQMDIALDIMHRKMYFAGGLGSPLLDGVVGRANFDGTGFEIIIDGLPGWDDYPTGTTIDVANERIYFSGGGGSYRANFDGSGLEPWEFPGNSSAVFDSTAVIPEPEPFQLAISGLLMLFLIGRYRSAVRRPRQQAAIIL
jgi:hypothetical protein